MTPIKPKIYILTGPIRTGKTTAIKNILRGKQAGGVLTPEKGSLRFLYDVKQDTWTELEVSSSRSFKDGIIAVGRFSFLASTIEEAKAIIRRDMSSYCGTLIIDELGKLEMRGEGLEPVITEAIAKFRTPENKNSIIIIIRETLLSDAIKSFGLHDAEIIDTELLSSVFT